MSYYYTDNKVNTKDRPLELGDKVYIEDDSWGFVIRADGTTSDTSVEGADYIGEYALLIALNCVLPQNADAASYNNNSSMSNEEGPDCVCRHESGDVLFLRSAFLKTADVNLYSA